MQPWVRTGTVSRLTPPSPLAALGSPHCDAHAVYPPSQWHLTGTQPGANFSPADQAGPTVSITGVGGLCGSVAPIDDDKVFIALRWVGGWWVGGCASGCVGGGAP